MGFLNGFFQRPSWPGVSFSRAKTKTRPIPPVQAARTESPSPRSYGERGWGEGGSGVIARSLSGRNSAFDVVHDPVICK